MPTNSYVTVQCPKCNKELKLKLWDVISREDHPRIAKRIISGTFFDYKCQYCGQEHSVNYPILYEDSISDAIICYETSAIGETKATRAIEQRRCGMKDVAKDYRIRVVRSTNVLREKARIFECGLDDRIIEIMKINLLEHDQIGQKIGNIEESLCWAEPNRGVLNFEFFGDKQYVIKASMEFYNYVKSKCDKYLNQQEPNPVYVDDGWAIDFLVRNNFTTQ